MRKIWFIIVLSITCSVVLFSSYWTEWIEYPANPVLDPATGPRAYYPSVTYDSNGFSGHGHAAYYKVWFGQGNGVGYSYSDDGINWTEYNNSAAVAGLNANANHPFVLYDENGFGEGVYYKIWYWTGGVSSIDVIRYAESADGYNWVNDQPIQQHATDTSLQLVTAYGVYNNWFYHCYGPGSVIYQSGASNVGSATPDDKTDDQPMTYSYIMYYDSSSEGSSPNGSVEQTSLAYSTDGKYWIRYGDQPVIIPSGDASDWDGLYSYRASVVEVSGEYHMWYAGANGDNSIGTYYAHGIGHASSTDGLNWTVDADNPVFHCTDGVAWRDVRSYTPNVIYDPLLFSGHGDPYPFKMWFTGRTGSNYTIGYAWLLPSSGGQPPTACFSHSPKKGYAPLRVQFNGGCSSDTDGFITAYRWDFGDESTGAGALISHDYSQAGEYTVSLTVEDDDGLTDRTTRAVNILSPVGACCKCTSESSADLTGFAPFTVEMDASCTTHYRNKEIVLYEWDMGNGDTAEGMITTYTYHTEGKYNVSLIVTDIDGYTNTVGCAEVTVYKVYPPEWIKLVRQSNRSLFKGMANHIITWSLHPGNKTLTIESFNIYRKNITDGEEEYKLIGSVDGSEHAYYDLNLPINIIYRYVVTSVESEGHESAPSEAVQNELY